MNPFILLLLLSNFCVVTGADRVNLSGVDGDTLGTRAPRTAVRLSKSVHGETIWRRQLSEPVQFRPQVHLIDQIALIESGNNSQAIGDKGKSRGAWQMTEAAWADVNSLRRRQQLPEFPWEMAHDDGTARDFACQYVCILSTQLAIALKRQPSNAELLAAYQTGFKGFQKRRFDLARVPKTTRRAVSKLK